MKSSITLSFADCGKVGVFMFWLCGVGLFVCVGVLCVWLFETYLFRAEGWL